MAEVVFMKPIPFFNLTRQYSAHKTEFDRAYRLVMKHGYFTLGPQVAAFESQLASYTGVKYGIGVGSGTDAITLALRAIGVRPGDEVIVPANAYPTMFAVALTGARIRLVDCKDDGNLDSNKLPDVLTTKTKAVVAVHLYGNPADIEGIAHVLKAKKSKAAILEDAAQAHGAEIQMTNDKWQMTNGTQKRKIKTPAWRRVGGIGDIGIFSFYPTKNVGAFGDGGLIVTNNEQTMLHLHRLRMYGEVERYKSIEISGVSRLDELQAAFLRVKLSHLEEWNKRRRAIAQTYIDELRNVGDIRFVSGDTPTSRSNYHLFVIRTASRDKLKNYLGDQGIGIGIHYPVPVHTTPAFRSLGYVAGDFPMAEKLSREVLSLPMFPELTREEVRRVIQAVRTFYTTAT